MRDFKEELKILEEDLGLSNVCLVKKIDPNTLEYVPSHIIFNYWVKATPISFKAVIKSKGYEIYFKDTLLFKTSSLHNVVKNLERKNIQVHLSNTAQPDIIKFEGEFEDEDEEIHS